MLSHVLYHAPWDILEETHVAELIHFIMTDSLESFNRFLISSRLLWGCDCRNAGTRERNLGG